MDIIGFRIFTKIERLDTDVIEKYKGFAVANIGDAMGRFQVMTMLLRPLINPMFIWLGPCYYHQG